MAYTLNYSLGTITVADTTVNTETSLSLPGRNYAGYGSPVDQNQLSILENFASYPDTGPSNPIPGQTWFNTTTGTLSVNTSANATANWTGLVSANTTGNVTLANVTVSGTLTATNITSGGSGVTGILTGAWALSTGSSFNFSAGTLITDTITTGANTTAGAMTGAWTLTSGSTLSTPSLNTTLLTTGANVTAGVITGSWTLSSGSSLNATYADLAERFEADQEYDAGTVMELGGEKEITAVREDASETIFGVISDSAGIVMNGAAGNDKTHPKIAMTGRVPVKVVGTVKKGERLISAGSGRARAAKAGEATSFNTVGRSLEDKLTSGEGKVLAAVSAKL